MSTFSSSPYQNTGLTLGIEGGGTRTTVLLADARDQVLADFTCGPANLRLMSPRKLDLHLQAIRSRLPEQPDRIGIGLAGARSGADFARLRQAIVRVWPGKPCTASDDLNTAFEAIAWEPDCPVQILVLSGTGSCILGRRRDPSTGELQTVKIGGRGHILGDRASACDISQHVLRALMTIYDEDKDWPALGGDILTHLQLNDPEDLIEWSLVADKTELADIAIPIFRAAMKRDPIAVAVLKRAAGRLAKDAVTCASHIMEDDNERVQFVFNGAVLLKNPTFADGVSARLRESIPNSIVTPLTRPSVWGAVELARASASICQSDGRPAKDSGELSDTRRIQTAASPTEKRNPRSTHFAELPLREAVALMMEEEATLPAAIRKETESIEWTIQKIVTAFQAGGRLIYAGAGTSGRLGVLDASECPPTFRVPPDQVQGIIAGGRTALWRAVEGAEDDRLEGCQAVSHRKVGPDDVVIGISASGHAPFVWGCLEEARNREATTVLLTFNPAHRGAALPDRVIAVETGPEVLTGSTRLKAGTATKLILNLLSTLAMAHSGKVIGNLMVDLAPSNSKLRDRAVRIVRELTLCSQEEALRALQDSAWVVREAVEQLKEAGGTNSPKA